MIAGSGRTRAGLLGLLVIVALGWPAASSAGAETPSYPEAVLLVSGFNTETPFTTPDPFCDLKEGPDWSLPTGPVAALKADGHAVFTAPVRRSKDPALAPCPVIGPPLPPPSAYIDSNGGLKANGEALATLLGFLRDRYGVARVQIVAHSDGGLWSRSAITQDDAYEGVEIRSLTTLGTPHTGSFLADLAIAVKDGKCDLSNRIERDICEGLSDVADLALFELGEAATRELTNDFLATWNPQQRIGSCPVTGIAGTFVDLPLPGFGYYNPADGEVGEASALAERSRDIELHPIPAPGIPNFRVGGTFPVVHSGAVKKLSPNNLLNTQAISDLVAEIVGATPAAGPLCNVQAAASGRAGPPSSVIRTRLPLNLIEAPSRRGRLPRPGTEDVVVAQRGVRVHCGGRSKLDLSPLFGDQRLLSASPAGCESQIRVREREATRGSGRPQALLLRSHPRNDVLLKVAGNRVRIRVRGPRVRHLRAKVRSDGGWRRLKLDRAGRGKLPSTGDRVDLRIRVNTNPGQRIASATAAISS